MNGAAVNRVYVKTRGQRRPSVAVRRPGKSKLMAARAGALPYRPMGSRYLASALAKEVGYVDLAVAGRAFDTTGTITLVATISQGAGTTQRVGKRCNYRSVSIKGSLFSGTTTTGALATLLLVYDRRPTGVLPAITDILVSANSRSFNNDDNSGRFEIVRRWDYRFTGNLTTPATGNEYQMCQEFVDLKNRPIAFKAAGTGAIGDIEQGALYLVTVGDQAAGTGAASSNLGIRTRFVDV